MFGFIRTAITLAAKQAKKIEALAKARAAKRAVSKQPAVKKEKPAPIKQAPQQRPTTKTPEEVMKRELDRQPSVTQSLEKHAGKGQGKEVTDSWVGRAPDTPGGTNASDSAAHRQRSLSLDEKGGPAL